ncbi:MAG TPA: hypothetical protein VG675_18275 [Bryobacteraceae bacterium]|nr:hypothetical protein [Bryobacteraceae bacterium]
MKTIPAPAFSTLSGLFAAALLAVPLSAQAPAASRIDRHALVSRQNITVHQADPLQTVAVGNGHFAFNADVTGLQSFPEFYEKTMPIGILSDWGWHSFPNPRGYSLEKFKLTCFPKYGRQVCDPYIPTDNPKKVSDSMLTEEARYLRSNPHRFGLGQIGLVMTKADGSAATLSDLHNIEQELDLWTGLLTSNFELEGVPVHVETAAHPDRDEVAVRVESPLIAAGRLKLRVRFSYPSGSWGPDYEDWDHPDAHQTTLVRHGTTGATFHRVLDSMRYDVRAAWSAGATLRQPGKHSFLLSGASKSSSLELVAWFSPKPLQSAPDRASAVFGASQSGWKQFWMSGGAIDFSGTDDPRARELERRVVLSQYITRVHSASSLPPQETGLVLNSWYGKFHMEMYWWHVAHFALWGRPQLLERSMDSLVASLPQAREAAERQGYKGAKWQKMMGPDWQESPSWVGPMLVWEQPHPIHLAELLYRDEPNRKTLERYKSLVLETAEYMASFLEWDASRKQYVLGPGIAAADEGHLDFSRNLNPTMELGYWRWGIETAQKWRERLGLQRDKNWDHILQNMAPLPVRDGVYPVQELPESRGASWMATWLYGVIAADDVDQDVMRRTLDRVAAPRLRRPQATVTWGLAMIAMCAARMGEPDTAVNLLAGKYEKNPFGSSGYAYRDSQTPAYFPASGGWLSAVAMMAAGWDGGPKTPAPGFPKDWKVRYEGLKPMP